MAVTSCTVSAANTSEPNLWLMKKTVYHCATFPAVKIKKIRLTFDSHHLCRPRRAPTPHSTYPAPSTKATDNVPLNGPPPYPLPRQLTSSLYPPGFTTVLPSVCSPAASGARPQSDHTVNDSQGERKEQKG